MSQPSSDPHDAVLRDEALAWHVRRGREDWTQADEAGFQDWLSAEPGRAQVYARCAAADRAMEGLPTQAVAALRARLAEDKAAQAAACRPARRGLSALAFAAMSGVLIVGILLAWQPWRATPDFTQAYVTQRGEQSETPLPDGSQLWLDTDTRVNVRYYPDRRELTLLGGQAMVRAQPDAARPLQVLAGQLRVTVVGTRFAVRHMPEASGAPLVQVAVEEGTVRVEARDAGAGDTPGRSAPLLLTAGQQVEAGAGGALSAVVPVSKAGVAPWRARRVSFVDTRLDVALAEFERYGKTGLVLRDPRAAGLRLTGTFDPFDAATFMRLLPQALPVRLRAQGGQTEILPE